MIISTVLRTLPCITVFPPTMQVMSQPSRVSSDFLKESNTAAVKGECIVNTLVDRAIYLEHMHASIVYNLSPSADEDALKDLCWIPFGFQSQYIGQEKEELCLQFSEVGKSILLSVSPGALSPSECAEVRYAVIPDGPFKFPEGYQLCSMVVYVYYNGQHDTRPHILRLPHWYGGEDHIKDGVSFAMAPHTLTRGERVYHFELLEGGRFADEQQCGVLQISGHCTLFAVVFKVKSSSFYYASLWTHDGDEISSNEMRKKVVITYADPAWIEVGIDH